MPVLNFTRRGLKCWACERQRLWTWLLHGFVRRSAIEWALHYEWFSSGRIRTLSAGKSQCRVNRTPPDPINKHWPTDNTGSRRLRAVWARTNCFQESGDYSVRMGQAMHIYNNENEWNPLPRSRVCKSHIIKTMETLSRLLLGGIVQLHDSMGF